MSPNVLKSLDDDHRRMMFKSIKELMDDPSVECEEWARSKLVLLPKKGNLSDLNDWRGINRLDVGSKISSIILNVRAQALMKSNGHPMKFGATPNVECADAVFSLKPHWNKEGNIESTHLQCLLT